jgi:hypothetical protein
MADVSDVEVALVNAALAILYPAGTAGSSAIGSPVRVYRGWPLPVPLEADLLAGVANISVFPVPDSGRDTTRWSPPTEVIAGIATLSVQVSGSSASFGGVAAPGQVAGVLADGQAFVHRCAAGDTPALVAAVLADSVRATRTCWLSKTTLTIPGATKLVGRVAADGLTVTETARQEQSFRIGVWCPTPSMRDVICGLLGSALSAMAFLEFADGGAGRLRYRSTASVDEDQDARQYRRDLLYDVEYGTFAKASSPAMLFGDLELAGGTILA